MDPIVLAVIAVAAGLYWYKTHQAAAGGSAPMGQIQGVANPYAAQGGGGMPMGGIPIAPPPGAGGAPQIPSLLQAMPPAAANGNVIALHNLAKNPATATAAYTVPPTATESIYAALAAMGYTVVPGGPTGAVAIPPSPPPVIQAYAAPAPPDQGTGASASFSSSFSF